MSDDSYKEIVKEVKTIHNANEFSDKKFCELCVIEAVSIERSRILIKLEDELNKIYRGNYCKCNDCNYWRGHLETLIQKIKEVKE